MKKKPCRICRRWFEPNAHAGQRQCICSAAACQAERRRRNAAAWRLANAERFAVDALTAGLQARPEPSEAEECRDPLARLSARAVRIAVGLNVQVVVGEYARLLLRAVRIAAVEKPRHERGVSAGVGLSGRESETAMARPPP